MIFLSSIINEIAHEIEIYLFSENVRKLSFPIPKDF